MGVKCCRQLHATRTRHSGVLLARKIAREEPALYNAPAIRFSVGTTAPMADITTDIPCSRNPASAFRLKAFQLVLLCLLACGSSWVAINEASARDRCETTIGRLAVRFKLDSYFSGCQCMKHSLDFSDSCNLMYLL